MKPPAPSFICAIGMGGLVCALVLALRPNASAGIIATVLLVTVATVTVLAALRVAYRLSGETGTWISPATAFLCFMAIHFCTGYWIAALIYDYIMPSDNNGYSFLLTCFDVYIVGLWAVSAGYLWGTRQKQRNGASSARFQSIVEKLSRMNASAVLGAAAVAALVGIAICAFIYHSVGLLPILSDDPGSRYLGSEYTAQSALYNSLLRRGLVFLTVSSPVLMLGWLRNRKSILLLMISALAMLTLAVTMRREPLVFAIICVVLVYALFGMRWRVLLLGVCVSLAIVLVIQFAVLGAVTRTGPNTAAISAAITYGEVFGEVREFAWLLSEWNGSYLDGRTLEAALLPVPATSNSFKDRNLMSSVTKDIVGIPEDAPHGGLRILVFGEAYLNFGYFGVIGTGLLFGLALAVADRFFWDIRRRMSGIRLTTLSVLPFVFLYAVLCYEIYLGGSVALADSFLGLVTLCVVYAAGSIKKREAKSAQIPPLAFRTQSQDG